MVFGFCKKITVLKKKTEIYRGGGMAGDLEQFVVLFIEDKTYQCCVWVSYFGEWSLGQRGGSKQCCFSMDDLARFTSIKGYIESVLI